MFDLAADPEKMGKDELYALQAALEEATIRGDLDDARKVLLRDQLARVDDAILRGALAR